MNVFRRRRHGSRRLTALFIAVLVPPALALVWLGVRLADQDRALQAQREAERREVAAEGVTRVLAQSVSDAERWLAARPSDDALPEGAVLITLSSGGPGRAPGVHVQPAGRVLWLPQRPTSTEPNPALFADAERLEFQGRGDRGRSRYEALARSSDAAVSAGALQRLARVHRQAGRIELALETYVRLAALQQIAINGMPADLVARRHICELLQGAGRERELRSQALALEEDLTSAAWVLDRADWELVATDLANWTGREPGSSERRALTEAVEWLAAQRGGADLPESGRRLLWLSSTPVTLIWRGVGEDVSGLALGPSVIDTWTQAAVQRYGGGLRASVLAESGEQVAGQAAAPGHKITRAMHETRLPWSLLFTPEPGVGLDSELAGRRRLLAAGLAALVLFLSGGSYMLWRVLQRELAVARLQTEFVAAVSHEFRTPLTSLRHMVELLQESDELPQARRHAFYSVLGHSTDRLHRLVESLLDFSRMEEGKRRWRREPVALGDLARRVVADFCRECPEASMVLDVEAAGAGIEGDAEALSHALWNLLDNAVKYSPGGGVIRVLVSAEASGVSLAITDQGLGISRNERRDIFRRFVRGADATRLGIKGTGLGLALVVHIVEAHHGRIEVESVEGKGSTFRILLPASRPDAVPVSHGAVPAHAQNPDR